MKKVMFAALVACAAGVAMADYGYDFTATLKTTVGKAGKDTTITYNLGKSGSTFWYQDSDADKIWYAGAKTTKQINGVTVPAIVKDNKGYLVTTNYYELAAEAIAGLAYEYDEKSAGKWCETVKVLIPAQCYRVAGTKKIKTVVYNDSCCSEERAFRGGDADDPLINYNDIDLSLVWSPAYNVTVTNTFNRVALLQSFGAQTLEKATKVEIYAPVFAYATDGTPFGGFLAGQGTRTGNRVNSISGNIVGILRAPTCENCCADPTEAIAFDCWTGDSGWKLLHTAAFGSFRIKYNKKY